MDLFEHSASDENAPLAHRLRPKNLESFFGQQHIFGKKQGLKEILLKGHIPNLLLWGPPGVGKTTFAQLVSNYVKAKYISINAIHIGAKDLKAIGEEAKKDWQMHQQKTIVFVDEVHRFNKAQQDVMLPSIERGDYTFIGATTENPSFQLNRALISRCRLLIFKKLERQDLDKILLKTFELWQKSPDQILKQEAVEYLQAIADGDARIFINNLEYLEQYLDSLNDLKLPLDQNAIQEIFHNDYLAYDRGEEHYNIISAFIKSIRGSNPDAAVYYLARMLEAGEDPTFIARRLVISASEDIGNADPKALGISTACFDAVEKIGMPEAAINLAQTTIYLASSPKSNRSYLALKKAQAEVKASGSLEIPLALRNAPTKLMKDIGYGKNYQYSHDYERGFSEQNFLPFAIKDLKFYEPSNHGHEKYIQEYFKWLKQKD